MKKGISIGDLVSPSSVEDHGIVIELTEVPDPTKWKWVDAARILWSRGVITKEKLRFLTSHGDHHEDA